MSDLTILVDEQDNEIGTRDRHFLQKGDIIRISSLWLENSKGQVLLAQRSHKKSHDPGLWAMSAAGTLEPGETYESNMYKEAEEEIGIRNIKLEPFRLLMFWRTDGTGRSSMYFKATVDKPAEEFVIQEDEVEKVAWINKSDLVKEIRENPAKFVENAHYWHKMFLT